MDLTFAKVLETTDCRLCALWLAKQLKFKNSHHSCPEQIYSFVDLWQEFIFISRFNYSNKTVVGLGIAIKRLFYRNISFNSIFVAAKCPISLLFVYFDLGCGMRAPLCSNFPIFKFIVAAGMQRNRLSVEYQFALCALSASCVVLTSVNRP